MLDYSFSIFLAYNIYSINVDVFILEMEDSSIYHFKVLITVNLN